jgi:hypothetical protein
MNSFSAGTTQDFLFPRFSLAVGYGHFRTKGDEPLAVPLNHGSVAISHARSVLDGGRTDNLKTCQPARFAP